MPAVIDVEKWVQRVGNLSPNKQKTLATILENMESGRDDDALLDREIAEFQSMGRPVNRSEKDRLRRKLTHV